MRPPKVAIVMATYNGENYLKAQVESIIGQSYSDWSLYCSDDGSSDRTLSLLTVAQSSDRRIKVLPPRGGDKGHVGNFEYLLNHALETGADWIFLADQDDVWFSEKLQVLLSLVECSAAPPLAAFSDLELINDEGVSVGSFMSKHGFEGECSVAQLLRRNSVVGCSMLLHRELLELALPFPDKLENHDWWLGLCAATTGRLTYTAQKLVRYRQHSNNAIGVGVSVSRLTSFLSVLRRQRRVFLSKLVAVEELMRRLEVRGETVPEELITLNRQFKGVAGWGGCKKLITSEFKPDTKVFFLVQLLAISPLISDD
ncbi:MAG: glycosyltransferase family 2 protein [Halioglobus sp.]